MKNETPRQLVRTPEIRSAFAGDPFIEPTQEINDLIARRATSCLNPADSPTAMLTRTGSVQSRKSCCRHRWTSRDGNRIHHPC